MRSLPWESGLKRLSFIERAYRYIKPKKRVIFDHCQIEGKYLPLTLQLCQQVGSFLGFHFSVLLQPDVTGCVVDVYPPNGGYRKGYRKGDATL
jgi:hypothetical protein